MGRDRVRRGWRLLLALVMGMWTVGAAPADPLAAQEERGIALTPSSGLRNGDIVQVELTGFAGETVVLFQCPSPVEIPPGTDPLSLLSRCRTDFQLRQISGSSVVVPFTIFELLSVVHDGTPSFAHCAARPGACSIVAYVLQPGEGHVVAPFDMVASPLALLPEGGDAGAAIRVFVAGEPGSEVTLAQCARPVADSLAASRCGPGTTVVLGPSGLTETEAVLAETLTTPAGTVDCVPLNCAMATFDISGNRLASREIGVSPAYPLNATVSPSQLDDLVDDQEIEVAVTGRPDRVVKVAQCDSQIPWGSDVDDGPCQVLAELGPVEPTEERRATVPVDRSFTGVDGSFVHCDQGDCWIVVQADRAAEFVSFGMAFAMNPTVSMSPSSGLVDGQPMTIQGSDLGESRGFLAVRCQGVTQPVPWREYPLDRCESQESAIYVAADATGALDVDVPASPRFQAASGAYHYCRDDCALGLAAGSIDYVFPYDMAEGSLSVSPASGLEDGQAVTATGSQLMSSYDGPPVWVFGSGQWSLVQCSREVLDDPSLLGVFTHCAVLSPGGVPVPGSELSTAVEVQARPTAILGEEIDCTAAVDACVVMLARLEQDGSISTHAASVSFDP